VRLGGAGNKCNNLVIGTVDSYISPSGLNYWDICAPESLVKGMGGYCTDFYQEKLNYSISGNFYIEGFISAKNPPMYKTIARRMGWI
jgi:3'-phosphoadenosine 5'-phosphosulfate (PAPS) 3'-phosphatase